MDPNCAGTVPRRAALGFAICALWQPQVLADVTVRALYFRNTDLEMASEAHIGVGLKFPPTFI
jgi:hypothetical protein